MSQQLDRFVDLLEDIFELKKSDLDFGIYRILNIRRKEILQFLREDLPAQVKAIIAPDAEDREKLKAEKAEIEKQAAGFGVEVEKTKKAGRYAELKYLLAQGADMESLQADVYSHLYNFFNRYYEEGDFISKRRYREGVYAIPYEGEEVKLYWANHDQYYIKTGENFRDYSFKAEGKTVHFRIVDASTEQNNNKENGSSKRCFMLMRPAKNSEHKTIEANGDDTELTIRFVYDVPEEKKNYNEENYSAICSAIAKHHKAWLFLTEAPKDQKPPLEKHYNAYVAKNSFDYFIHKDLLGFLTRELDFYIKNEVIHLDDIETANEKRMGFWLAKAKAIKHIGGIIIRFLAQIEEFQKKLWLKKKFIVDTGWCITLDKIPAAFYEEIRKNKAQVQEWIDLYAVDDINGNGELGLRAKFTNPPKIEFLEQNQNLVVDTKHFSREFTERLAASIDNLDAETGGVLIHSENFQALNLLRERYREKIDCIYIDPPYNTSASEILYKNGYRDSSWLSMIFDRCDISKGVLCSDGVFAFAIDDTEEKYVHNLLDTVFNKNELGTVAVRNNPSGRPMKTGFAVSHEYTLFYSKNPDIVVSKMERDELLDKRYKEQDEKGPFMWELLRKRGSDSERANSPKAYYPFYYDGKTFRLPKMKWNDLLKTWEYIEDPKENEIVCWPIDESGVHRRWRWGVETAMENLSDLLYKENGVGTVYYKYRPPENLTATTNWIDSKYSSTEHGTGYLKKMFTDYALFSYPKSIYAVEDSLRVMGLKNNCLALDYFAGSGTTGHAVINLNRQDGGSRKYILVEMGEYFDTVTKPRMQKAVYADEWKDGKPRNRTSGISQIIKYFTLESYEDTLNNITFRNSNYKKSGLYDEEYLIGYMLDTEAKGSLFDFENFTRPFDYKLKITEKNETKEKTIDLVETFNYLIGLAVKRLFLSGGFKTVEGSLPSGEKALVVWRNISGNAREDDKALGEYFKKLRREIDFAGLTKVFVNGDTAPAKLRQNAETFDVCLTEAAFKEKMFEA